MRVALLYLTPEGVNTWVAGVGSVINSNFKALPEAARKLAGDGVELSVFFATPAAGPSVRGWNPGQMEKAQAVAASLGGGVRLLPNYTDGTDNFGRLDQWRVASAAGAEYAYEVASRFERTVVLAHSSHPFALAPVYIDMQRDLVGVDVTTVYIIHSTSIQDRTFTYKGGKYPDHERAMVEGLAVQWAKSTDSVKLGYISHYMAHHLMREHGARLDTLVPTLNGVDVNDPHFKLLPEGKRKQVLEKYGVPTDRPLLVSWGRFVPEKGFAQVLDATARSGAKLHPVIVGMVDHSPEYPAKVVEFAKGLGLPHSIVVERDWELVAALLEWKHTRVAALMSAYDEPHGLVVNEARMHAREGGPVVVVSNRGGLPEQVTDGVDGFVADIDDLDSAAATIAKAAALSDKEHAKMRAASMETIKNRYDFAENIAMTVRAALGLARYPIKDVLHRPWEERDSAWFEG